MRKTLRKALSRQMQFVGQMVDETMFRKQVRGDSWGHIILSPFFFVYQALWIQGTQSVDPHCHQHQNWPQKPHCPSPIKIHRPSPSAPSILIRLDLIETSLVITDLVHVAAVSVFVIGVKLLNWNKITGNFCDWFSMVVFKGDLSALINGFAATREKLPINRFNAIYKAIFIRHGLFLHRSCCIAVFVSLNEKIKCSTL